MSLHALGLAVTGNAGNKKACSMLSCSFLQHGGTNMIGSSHLTCSLIPLMN